MDQSWWGLTQDGGALKIGIGGKVYRMTHNKASKPLRRINTSLLFVPTRLLISLTNHSAFFLEILSSCTQILCSHLAPSAQKTDRGTGWGYLKFCLIPSSALMKYSLYSCLCSKPLKRPLSMIFISKKTTRHSHCRPSFTERIHFELWIEELPPA